MSSIQKLTKLISQQCNTDNLKTESIRGISCEFRAIEDIKKNEQICVNYRSLEVIKSKNISEEIPQKSIVKDIKETTLTIDEKSSQEMWAERSIMERTKLVEIFEEHLRREDESSARRDPVIELKNDVQSLVEDDVIMVDEDERPMKQRRKRKFAKITVDQLENLFKSLSQNENDDVVVDGTHQKNLHPMKAKKIIAGAEEMSISNFNKVFVASNLHPDDDIHQRDIFPSQGDEIAEKSDDEQNSTKNSQRFPILDKYKFKSKKSSKIPVRRT